MDQIAVSTDEVIPGRGIQWHVFHHPLPAAGPGQDSTPGTCSSWVCVLLERQWRVILCKFLCTWFPWHVWYLCVCVSVYVNILSWF